MISRVLSTSVVFRRCSAIADRALIHPKERTLVRTLLLCGRDAPEPREKHANDIYFGDSYLQDKDVVLRGPSDECR